MPAAYEFIPSLNVVGAITVMANPTHLCVNDANNQFNFHHNQPQTFKVEFLAGKKSKLTFENMRQRVFLLVASCIISILGL